MLLNLKNKLFRSNNNPPGKSEDVEQPPPTESEDPKVEEVEVAAEEAVPIEENVISNEDEEVVEDSEDKVVEEEQEPEKETKEEAPDSDDDASIVPTEPVPSTMRNDMFVQSKKSFWRRNKEELKKESQSADAFGSRKLTYSDTAITFQFVFHNIALVVQGFLSGLAVFHTIFAFTMIKNAGTIGLYQEISPYLQTTFYFCFTVSLVNVLDRFESTNDVKTTLIRWLSLGNGGFATLICLTGMLSTVIMTKYEEELLIRTKDASLPSDLLYWQWLSLARAVSAVGSWLMMALQPSLDFTKEHLAIMLVNTEQTQMVPEEKNV